jgi:succinate dehydrogenase/fumarate reductase flavoprotein subunit
MSNGEPWPDYFDHAPENKAPRGRLLFPKGPPGFPFLGSVMVSQLNVAREAKGVGVLLNHRVARLVVDHRGEVIGLEATTGESEQTVSVRARRAVVFGSGGFTHNPELRLHFQRGPVFGGCAARTNEGDFVHAANGIGAKLGNMTSAWRLQVVLDPSVPTSNIATNVWQTPGDSMILVNKYGHRVVNEKRSYNDRAEVHFNYDPSREEWPNLVLFMVYDQRSAEVFAGNFPIPFPGSPPAYVLSGNSLDELADEIAARLAQLAPRTGGYQLDPRFAENLRESVIRFNGFAETGVDEDFQRGAHDYDRDWHTYQFSVAREGTGWPANDKPNPTLYPLSPPYHAIILASGTLDTNGGPMIDGQARVLSTIGEPIPGLYGAGNCIASPAGRAYWGGGCTLGLALTFGYLAGRNAAEGTRQRGNRRGSS